MVHITVTSWNTIYDRPAGRRKRPNLSNPHRIVIHDGVRSHISASMVNLLRRWNWGILEYPPYTPEMSPFNNVAEGTIWGIIKESAYVIGRINTANQQMIEVVTSAVKDIGGNVTMAIGTAALGRVEDTIKFLKGSLQAIHNFQTAGFNTLNNILDGMSSVIINLIDQTANPTIGTTHPHPYHRQLHIAEPKSAVVQETLKTTTNSVETGRLSKDLDFRATEAVRGNRMDACPLQNTILLQNSVRESYDYTFDTNGEILFMKFGMTTDDPQVDDDDAIMDASCDP
ncbi:hypothetical protein ANN_26775 [Periplaneta americana]|uniref:DDE-1 domain-containing protein n=1 Tax=Periplaneta americana TaxID=6978 RepID=A0ABQ8RZ59_PERAM|nr:hypothetical protein ANN_26775 [Periplaneta americana]